MNITDERENILAQMVCDAFKPRLNLLQHLVEQIQRKGMDNERKTRRISAANIWRGENLSPQRKHSDHLSRKRKQTRNKELEGEIKTGSCITLFRQVVRKVCMLKRIFRKMSEFAIEKGGHGDASTGAMQLKDTVVGNDEQKDLLFDPNVYVSRYQVCFPRWARTSCSLPPLQRNKEQLQNIVNLMKQLKDFRKYSNKMLLLLAKIVRYERFGRRRVIIRKGHIGMCFYVIFSGSVGVVVGGDEDKAFENEERSANVLKKGDSFGELALVRRSMRTATVVCLENTEFLVIDKEDFFSSGIDKFSQEEMLFRYRFIRSMDLFESWDDDVLQEVAEGGRNIEYLSDRVIEVDSTQTEYVYIITKGTCNVLRLLDLTTQDSLMERDTLSRASRLTSSGYQSTYLGSVSKTSLPVYNDPCDVKNTPSDTVSHMSDLSLDKRSKVKFNSEGSSSSTSISSSNFTKGTLSRHSRQRSRRQSTPVFGNVRKTQKGMPVVFSQIPPIWYEEAIRNSNSKESLGLGAFIRVDSLTKGQAFGMKYLLHEDDQDFDCKRKFTLLSSGCEVIRIAKTVLKACADEMTIKKIKKEMFTYESDEELYVIFKRQNNWRCFREELVDHIADYRNDVEKAFKERCVSIPKLPSIQRKCISRAPSPSEHWQELVDGGHIRKSPSSTWSISPRPPLPEDTKHAPFLQQRILSSKSSQRTLILTHGGSRVNKLQLTTNCNLTHRKPRNNRLISYMHR